MNLLPIGANTIGADVAGGWKTNSKTSIALVDYNYALNLLLY